MWLTTEITRSSSYPRFCFVKPCWVLDEWSFGTSFILKRDYCSKVFREEKFGWFASYCSQKTFNKMRHAVMKRWNLTFQTFFFHTRSSEQHDVKVWCMCDEKRRKELYGSLKSTSEHEHFWQHLKNNDSVMCK